MNRHHVTLPAFPLVQSPFSPVDGISVHHLSQNKAKKLNVPHTIVPSSGLHGQKARTWEKLSFTQPVTAVPRRPKQDTSQSNRPDL